MIKAIVIVGVVIAAAIVISGLAVLVRRLMEGPSVRRRDLDRTRERLQHALVTIDLVDDARENWRDVDSPLAAELRKIIREHKEWEQKLI